MLREVLSNSQFKGGDSIVDRRGTWFAALLVACGGGGSKAAKPPGSSIGSRKLDAWVMAQLFLERDHLRSPSTADYGSAFRGNRQDPATCVRDLGEGIYLVEGWVDAQNAFGATVRNNFIIKLEHLGGETWRVIGQPAMALYPEVPDYVDMHAGGEPIAAEAEREIPEAERLRAHAAYQEKSAQGGPRKIDRRS